MNQQRTVRILLLRRSPRRTGSMARPRTIGETFMAGWTAGSQGMGIFWTAAMGPFERYRLGHAAGSQVWELRRTKS